MYGSVKLSPYNYWVPDRPLDPPDEEYYEEEEETVRCAYCSFKVPVAELDDYGFQEIEGDLYCGDCIAELERAAE